MENLQEKAEEAHPGAKAGSRKTGTWVQCPTPDLFNAGLRIVKEQTGGAADGGHNKDESEEALLMAKGSGRGNRPTGESWDRIRKKLEVQLGKDVFDSWFGRLKLCSLDGGVVMLSVPTAFLKTWIQSKYREKLLELWQEEEPGVLRVDIAVRKPVVRKSVSDAENAAKRQDGGAGTDTNGNGKASPRFIPNTTAGPRGLDYSTGFPGSPLDVRHTFETFIEGSSNRMVYAAARTIAEDITASHFNPLFIHANVGLGEDASAPGHCLAGAQQKPKSKGPVSDG